VHSYGSDYHDLDQLRERITELNARGLMDRQVADVLNAEGVLSARSGLFTYENIWLLRKRWGLKAVKLNPTGANPPRWADGSYSVQGAATAIGVTPQVIFDYTSIPQVGEKWLAVVAASDSSRGHDSRWLS
jgi:hypothetical protein